MRRSADLDIFGCLCKEIDVAMRVRDTRLRICTHRYVVLAAEASLKVCGALWSRPVRFMRYRVFEERELPVVRKVR